MATEEKIHTDLTEYKWKTRLVLIFTPSIDDVDYQTQLVEFDRHLPGVIERDIVFAHILENGSSTIGCDELADDSAEELRRRYDVKPGKFYLVLVGKDNTWKLWTDFPISADELFAVIDDMPMRRAELMRKNAGRFLSRTG
jgi:hypothetical protein